MASPWYVLRAEDLGVSTLVDATLEVSRPMALRAEAQAPDGLGAGAPPAATEAWAALCARRPRGAESLAIGLRRLLRLRAPVRIDSTDDDGWANLAVCAPWVEFVDFLDGSRMAVARIREGGHLTVLRIEDDAAKALAASLGEAVTVERLADNRIWWRMNT